MTMDARPINASAPGGPVRLLSIPGRGHENKYFAKLLGALEQRGIRIVGPQMRELLLFRYDVLQLNFPTHQITENGLVKAAFLSLLFAAYLLAARALQRTIIYTVHDVVPLRSRHRRLLGLFLRFIHSMADGFVFLSHSSRRLFAAHYGQHHHRKPWVLAPHAPYEATLLTPQDRAASRRQLARDSNVFMVGFLGAIKPYKNIQALQQLPAYLPDGRPVHVVVAGRVEPGHEAAVAHALRSIPPHRLTRIDQRLTDAALNRLIQAVDMVLLPYAAGSNSGAALLVLSNRGRLAGSDLGLFRELAEQVGAPWAYALDGSPSRSYRDLIVRAAQETPTERDRLVLAAYLASIDCSVAAEAIERLCRGLLGRAKRHRLVLRGATRHTMPSSHPIHPARPVADARLPSGGAPGQAPSG